MFYRSCKWYLVWLDDAGKCLYGQRSLKTFGPGKLESSRCLLARIFSPTTILWVVFLEVLDLLFFFEEMLTPTQV